MRKFSALPSAQIIAAFGPGSYTYVSPPPVTIDQEEPLRHHIAFCAALCALAGAAPSLPAQAQPAQSGPARITGVAIDSIRSGYLRNAVISVAGTSRHAVTDSAGRFTIDSVPPGQRSLSIRHALLDSIGLAVLTTPKAIQPGESVSMLVSTPAPSAIIAAKCPADTAATGRAAVIGTVFDTDSEDPSTGAQVTAEWTEIQLRKKSIQRVPRKRVAQVSSDGRFRLCGLPADLRSGIRAARGADTTAAVAINFESGLAIVALHLPRPSLSPPVRTAVPALSDSPEPPAPVANARSVITGRVTNVENVPVSGARITIEEDDLTAVTAADGTFRINGVKLGTRALNIRKLGYEPVRMVVNVAQREPFDVDIKLAKFVAVLETVRISAIRDRALERNGFTARRHRGMGTYITPEQIARRNSARVNDMLRGISYLHFTRLPNGTDIITGRPSIVAGGKRGCVRYFVDGVPWVSAADSPDGFYNPSEIGAIEVYPPSVAPAEFMRFSQTGELCYVIVLWTQSGLRLP